MTDIALVTGATGFIGSAVVRRLLASGFHVRALVRESSRLENLQGLDVELVTGDLGDTDSLRRALSGCRALFHIAADYRLWVPHPARLYAVNVEGSRNIMLAAAHAGVSRVVYTSSVATLAVHADRSPANEDDPVNIDDMIGHYKRSKFLAEHEVRELGEQQRLDTVIVNPAAPLGPRDIRPTPTGRMLVDAARGRMPAYVDTGLDIVHVDDVATGHLLAYEHGANGRRYILGGENLGLREILCRVAAMTGRAAPRVRLPNGMVLPLAWLAEGWAHLADREPAITVAGVKLARKHMYYSHARATQELGYQPRPAQHAIEDAVHWFAAHGYL